MAVQGVHAVTQVVQAVKELDELAGGRRDHRGARRRQRGGPAAVLGRAADPGGRRVPYAGGVRDRARAGLPAARPGRRPAGVHARRTRRRRSCRTWARSWTGCSSCGTGRCGRVRGCSTGRSAGSRTRWPGPSMEQPHRMVDERAAEVDALIDRSRRMLRASAGPGGLGAVAHPGAGGRAVARGDAGARVRGAAAAGRSCGPLPGRRGGGRRAAGAGVGGRVHRAGGRVSRCGAAPVSFARTRRGRGRGSDLAVVAHT